MTGPPCNELTGTIGERRDPRLRRKESRLPCKDLVDLSDIFPTLCELTGAKLPDQSLPGRSFAPQLLGKPGTPREWIHVQDGDKFESARKALQQAFDELNK
jgi:arylsulfatase A-like enzyme